MPALKPLQWVGRSREELLTFPQEVRRNMGYALHFAQAGTKHPSAKPLKGFGGAGILGVVEDHDGNAYRAVYCVRFPEAVYALHAFQKKSRSGVKTPGKHIDIVRQRLQRAEEYHRSSKNPVRRG